LVCSSITRISATAICLVGTFAFHRRRARQFARRYLDREVVRRWARPNQTDRGRRDARDAGADQGALVPGGERARANPTKEQVLARYAAQHSVMENANALAAKAIRTCGASRC